MTLRSLLLRLAKSIVWTVCPAAVSLWLEERYYLAYGETELTLLPHLCDRDRDAIDVGANHGCYTLFMRKYARHVVAFEPNPRLADELARKFDPDVTVCPDALSRGSSRAPLHIPVVDGGEVAGLGSLLNQTHAIPAAEDREILVTTRALDETFSGDVGFIKIDVEGHENAVLEGAQTTIARCRPNALVELEERHSEHAIDQARAFFASLNYRGYFVRDGEILPIERFDLQTMQRREDIERVDARSLASPTATYTNNFLFLPSERSEEIVNRIARTLGPRRRAAGSS